MSVVLLFELQRCLSLVMKWGKQSDAIREHINVGKVSCRVT